MKRLKTRYTFNLADRIKIFALLCATTLLTSCITTQEGQRYRAMRQQLDTEPVATLNPTKPAPVSFAAGAPLALQDFVKQTVERNPTIASARASWRAAVAEYPQVTAWADPQVSYTTTPRTLDDKEVRNGEVLSISQPVPFPGKLRLKGVRALAEARAAQNDFEATRHQLAKMAVMFYMSYYRLHHAVRINAHHIEQMKTLKNSAEAKYAAGQVTQQDPLQAEVELARLETRKVEIESQLEIAKAQMNRLLNRPVDAELPAPPENLDVPALPAMTKEELLRLAQANRPNLEASAARIEAAKAGVDLAQREYFPDFSVMATYNSMWMDLDHQLMVGVGLTLPIQVGRRSAAVDSARARLSKATFEKDALVNNVATEVYEAWENAQKSLKILGLYQDHLLPAARDQVAAARSAFESGRLQFGTLVDAENSLRGVMLQYQEALANFYTDSAELQRSTGNIPFYPLEGEEQK